MTGLAGACARFVHPRVDEAKERARQQRFLATLFAAPFLLAVGLALPAAGALGAAGAVAVVCAVLGSGWLIGLCVAWAGRSRVLEIVALCLGSLSLSTAIAAQGGAATPLVALVALLPIEAFLVARTRRAARWGIVAAIVAAVAGFAAATRYGSTASDLAPIWQWLLPLAYFVSLWRRGSALLPAADETSPDETRQNVSDLMQAAIVRMDREGEVLEASGSMGELLGVDCDLMLGKGLFERIHIGDRVAYLSALADLRRGQRRSTVAMRIRVAGGSARTEYAPISAELIQDGTNGAILAILRDDKRAADLDLALRRTSERAQKSDLTRTRMLGSVSHELRTPLNAILGFSDALSRDTFGVLDGQRQREYVHLIHEAGQHLLSVVNALLDLSRIESGALDLRPEIFDIEEAVALSLSFVECQAREREVRLHSRIDADIGTVCCDRRVLQQVLINLLSNAVKFTPAGGRVTVAARRTDDRLNVEVADTGIGMAKEDLARVGTPFMQVESEYARQHEGTGLGLSLVKGLVELQRGGMSIESAPGAGTKVSISLPLKQEPSRGSEANENERERTGGLIDGGFLKTA